jgi:hypothetical protein
MKIFNNFKFKNYFFNEIICFVNVKIDLKLQ